MLELGVGRDAAAPSDQLLVVTLTGTLDLSVTCKMGCWEGWMRHGTDTQWVCHNTTASEFGSEVDAQGQEVNNSKDKEKRRTREHRRDPGARETQGLTNQEERKEEFPQAPFLALSAHSLLGLSDRATLLLRRRTSLRGRPDQGCALSNGGSLEKVASEGTDSCQAPEDRKPEKRKSKPVTQI